MLNLYSPFHLYCYHHLLFLSFLLLVVLLLFYAPFPLPSSTQLLATTTSTGLILPSFPSRVLIHVYPFFSPSLPSSSYVSCLALPYSPISLLLFLVPLYCTPAFFSPLSLCKFLQGDYGIGLVCFLSKIGSCDHRQDIRFCEKTGSLSVSRFSEKWHVIQQTHVQFNVNGQNRFTCHGSSKTVLMC